MMGQDVLSLVQNSVFQSFFFFLDDHQFFMSQSDVCILKIMLCVFVYHACVCVCVSETNI